MGKEMREQINKIKNFGQFLNENIVNNSSDSFSSSDVMFHGTSLNYYLDIVNNGFIVKDLYLTTSQPNAIEYAHITSDKNNDEDAILFVFNYDFLDGILKDDIHDVDYTDGEFDLKQDGQYIFSGNIKKAIYHVYNLITKKEIINYKSLA